MASRPARARLAFHGAARAVTGSCFRLETPGGAVLIDCGMVQGSKTEKELNYRPFPFDPADLAGVVLTHAHIDHSGLLPKLVKAGYAGAIHATPATTDLAAVMLPDSAHIQTTEVEQLNRRRGRGGRRAVAPIYDGRDAEVCLERFAPQDYGDWFVPARGVRARFWNAGHMLGSASVEVEVAGCGRDGGPLRLLFSGDVGPNSKLLQPDPDGPSGLDYVICEGTYGDEDRVDSSDAARLARLRDEVLAAMRPDGALLIPAFAVERAQELISDLTRLMAEGAIPEFSIHVDSPLAARATRVFARHARDLERGGELVAALRSREVRFTESVEQSMALDRARGFHAVIAASGMCEAGRIRHRLKNWIWREEATVLIVGYQAVGTLGRILQEGAPSVRIQGDDFVVRARIRTIDLYSGHADGPELVDWVRARGLIAAGLFLVHGEPQALAGLAARLEGVVPAARVETPELDAQYTLDPDGARREAEGAPPRLRPEQVARRDWHNDVSKLMLDIDDALRAEADERARNVLIRRLRRALEGEAGAS